MPAWYLILSAIVGLAVLAGVAYSYVTAGREEPAYAGDFDGDLADAPTRREAQAELPTRAQRDRTVVR